MQVLKRLENMSSEEGVALMKQLFNPMRGVHVGYIRAEDRRSLDRMAQEKQNKVEEESSRGTPRQMDLFTGRTSIHNRAEEAQSKGKSKDWA